MRDDADAVASPVDAAFQQIANVQQPPYLRDVDRLPFEPKGGGAGDHPQRLQTSERIGDLIGEPVGEILRRHVGG